MAVAAGRRNKKKAAGAPNTGDPSPGPLVTCADPGRAKLKHFYTCVAETYTVPRGLEIAAESPPLNNGAATLAYRPGLNHRRMFLYHWAGAYSPTI